MKLALCMKYLSWFACLKWQLNAWFSKIFKSVCRKDYNYVKYYRLIRLVSVGFSAPWNLSIFSVWIFYGMILNNVFNTDVVCIRLALLHFCLQKAPLLPLQYIGFFLCSWFLWKIQWTKWARRLLKCFFKSESVQKINKHRNSKHYLNYCNTIHSPTDSIRC